MMYESGGSLGNPLPSPSPKDFLGATRPAAYARGLLGFFFGYSQALKGQCDPSVVTGFSFSFPGKGNNIKLRVVPAGA